MTPFVNIRLLRAILLALSAMLATSAGLNLALLVADFYEIRLTIDVFGKVLSAQAEALGGNEVKIYYLCNTIISFAFFVASILTLKIARTASWSPNFYKRSAFKLLAVVALLYFAELIRALIKILLLRSDISSSDYVGYAAISCLAILSLVLIRGADVIRYYDESV